MNLQKVYQNFNQMQQYSPNHQNQKQPYDVLQQQREPQIGQHSSKIQHLNPSQSKYKSFTQILFIILNIGLSSFYFGYILAYFSSVEFHTLAINYNIQIKKQVAQGLLVGCIPIGGGIGALSASILIKYLSRRQSIFLVNFIAIFAGILLFYPTMYALLLARLMQGICIGLYSSLVPIIMKQLSPYEIAGTLTSFHQILISFGVFFAFAFSLLVQTIYQDPLSQKTWKIVFFFPFLPLVLQTVVLKFIYNFETPRYLYLNNYDEQGKLLVQNIYKPEYVQETIKQIKQNVGRGQSQKNQNGLDVQSTYVKNNTKNKLFTTPRAAGIAALHLAAMQQFSGVNAILAYGGQNVAQLAPSIKLILPILINLLQAVAAVFSSYLLTKVGRKTLFQYGCITSALSCFIVAIGFFQKDQHQSFALVCIVTGLIIFMGNFGLTLGPVVWVYLPQVVLPQFIPYATGVNWGSAALIMLLFPMIKKSLPNQNPAFLFVFFSLWCIISFFVNNKLLIQTKGKTQKQISEQFREKKALC